MAIPATSRPEHMRENKFYQEMAEAIYEATVRALDKDITDMTGIEAFSTLLSLDCSNNAITDLNVSNNSTINSIYQH